MSIAAAPVGEQPIAAQGGAIAAARTKPPPKRQVVARTDRITDPEAR